MFGAALADVAGVDVLEEAVGDEVVPNLPDGVGKDDEESDGDGCPELSIEEPAAR